MHLKKLALFIVLTPWLVFAADIPAMKADGMAALNGQRFEDAARIYREVLAANTDDAEAHYRLGAALMGLGLPHDDAALGAFEAALTGGFQAAAARIRLAQLHARNDRTAEALAQLQAAAQSGFGATGMIDGITEFNELRGAKEFLTIYETMRGNRYPCEADPNAHAFDFWIGDWNVYVGGQLAGTNSIRPILHHCAISEKWASAGGGYGRSYNYYDTGTRTWNQVWISDSGSFVEFEGEARDGGIFYTAETVNATTAAVTLHKFYFTVFDNGDVRQVWEVSSDDGKSWTTTWDSRYVRMVAPEKKPAE